MKSITAAAILSFIASAAAGTIVWDGSFDYYSSASAFDNWSWSNEVGEYQWYIHGTNPTTSYLALDPSYKNPADTRESKGLKMTVDSSSHWNGQTMMRTELIPQTTANLGTGQLYYHFSLMHQSTNPPGTSEHQIFFFESHFTELKVGIGSDLTKLNWCIGGVSQWTTDFVAGTWYNFAYDIDFSGGTTGLWFSTGSNPLTKVVANKSSSPSTNSADFHVGVLRLGDSSTEDWYVSCVYIESGSINANHCNTGGTVSSASSSTPSSSSSSSSSRSSSSSSSSSSKTSSSSSSSVRTSSTTSSASGAQQTKWGQCGGQGYTGPTVCVSGSTCTYSNAWYSQCL